MSTELDPANQLRTLLQPYLADVQKWNGRETMRHMEENRRLVERGAIPRTLSPQFKQPSFNDLMYWVQQVGDYKPEGKS